MTADEEQVDETLRQLALSLPASIIRDSIYPFAVRVFANGDQLRAAVQEYMEFVNNQRPFPNGYIPIEDWDVSNVTNFSEVFYDAGRFQGDLSRWDVSKGTNFSHMFYGCESFNSDLSRWDVSKGTNLSGMFYRCESFNSDLSRWDVSKGTDFSFMFNRCASFNSDLSRWDVSSAADLSCMF